MLKLVIRIALFALLLAHALPALGMGNFAGDIWIALGAAALCTILALIGNVIIGLIGVAQMGPFARSAWHARVGSVVVNDIGSTLIYLGALALTADAFEQYLGFVGIGALLLTAVIFNLIGHVTGGQAMKVEVHTTINFGSLLVRSAQRRHGQLR